MSARDRILQKVHQSLKRPTPVTVTRPERLAAPMARPVSHFLNDFVARAESLQSTTAQVPDFNAVPAAVAQYIQSHGLPRKSVIWPSLKALEWFSWGLTAEVRPPVSEDRIGITETFCGIAETGTLLLHSGVNHYSTTSLLPETHIAILRVDRIVERMEQAFALMQSELGQLPRATNFISGPSRTADIEQTIVIGAHGPRRVHIILVG
jgi:L-lactate dehydrogenase complex protein LldG